MKIRIHAMIDQKLSQELDCLSKKEGVKKSELIELALGEFFSEQNKQKDEAVISHGRFVGKFSRNETYAPERL